MSRLNTWAQVTTGNTDCLSYSSIERPGVHVLGKVLSQSRTKIRALFASGKLLTCLDAGPRFGCTLVINAQNDNSQRFESEAVYPSKKQAKEAVAKLAVHAILAPKSYLPTQTDELPKGQQLVLDSVAPPWQVPQPSTSYQTIRNARVRNLQEDRSGYENAATVPPPPYTAQAVTHEFHPGAPRDVGQSSVSCGPSTEPYVPSTSAHEVDGPNLQVLRQHLAEAFGPNGPKERMSFHLYTKKGTGLYRGFLRLVLKDDHVQIFDIDTLSASAAAAKDALCAKALSGDLWKQLSLVCQSESQRTSSNAMSKTTARARSYHPVSYVHQMCQILLGTGPEHKPNLEVFKPGDTCESSWPAPK